MVAAEILVDGPEVGPELIGAGAAIQDAIGQQHTVIGKRARFIDTVKLRRLGRDIAAP